MSLSFINGELKPGDRVWRYMEFAQLVSILDDGGIFCPTIETMHSDDPWEGMWSQEFLDREQWERTGRGMVALTPELEEQGRAWYNELIQRQLGALPRFAISCWRLHKHESDAMWKAYIEGDFGVAIETTFAHLKSAFEPFGANHQVFLGPVIYGTRENQNVIAPFFHKRADFATDSEVRVVIQEKGNIEGPGVLVPVDLAGFIQRVWISPRGGKRRWFVKAVQGTLKRYGLENVEVKTSELLSGPKLL